MPGIHTQLPPGPTAQYPGCQTVRGGPGLGAIGAILAGGGGPKLKVTEPLGCAEEIVGVPKANADRQKRIAIRQTNFRFINNSLGCT